MTGWFTITVKINHHWLHGVRNMTANEIDCAKNPLLRLALPALQRAAKNARDQAMLHKTQLIIWQDDHIVKLSPVEIREQAGDYRTEWCRKVLEHEEKNKAGKTAYRLARQRVSCLALRWVVAGDSNAKTSNSGYVNRKEITGRQRKRLFAYDGYIQILSEGTEPL